jgi:ABC-type lipoprotein release transport system permease subunit
VTNPIGLHGPIGSAERFDCTLPGAVLLLTIVVLVAWIPAHRAAAVNPVQL